MTLEFTHDEGIGNFKMSVSDDEYVTISVCSYYNNSFPGQTHEDQLNKVRKMLNGKQLTNEAPPYFSNRNGSSWFNIDFENDRFTLDGGEFGLTFGDSCKICCSYSKNKEHIDNFMRFILGKEDIK